MAQLAVLMAGLLLIAESQASDMADRSTLQGFLIKYVPSGSAASQSSMRQDSKQDAQKLIANKSKSPISWAAIGIGLFSLGTILQIILWVRLCKILVAQDTSNHTCHAWDDTFIFILGTILQIILAMLGIFGFLAESKAPGSVPALQGLIPEYSGDYMVPFEGSFSFFNY